VGVTPDSLIRLWVKNLPTPSSQHGDRGKTQARDQTKKKVGKDKNCRSGNFLPLEHTRGTKSPGKEHRTSQKRLVIGSGHARKDSGGGESN